MHPVLKDIVGGSGCIKSVNDPLVSNAKYIYPFNCAPLDISYGGGIPSGKIMEIFGYESHGKSTFAIECCKAFINYWKSKGDDNYGVLWIETESAFNRDRAEFMGCDTSHFLITEAETIEDAEECIISTLDKIAGKMKILIVWDTIAAAATRNEMKGDEFGGGMMFKPRFLRQMFRKITNKLANTDSTMIAVNQTGGSADSMVNGVIPNTPGGGGLKFHASIRTFIVNRTQLSRLEPNGKEATYGIAPELQHVKNKMTTPKQRCQITLLLDKGLDTTDTLLRFMQEYKFVTIAGAWKNIELPEHVWGVTKDENGKPIDSKMVKISYQNPGHILEKANTLYPHVFDWMNYVVYKYNADKKSSLLKIRIIEKVWSYEMQFFGRKVTTLTDEERRIARRELEENLKEADKETE